VIRDPRTPTSVRVQLRRDKSVIGDRRNRRKVVSWVL